MLSRFLEQSKALKLHFLQSDFVQHSTTVLNKQHICIDDNKFNKIDDCNDDKNVFHYKNIHNRTTTTWKLVSTPSLSWWILHGQWLTKIVINMINILKILSIRIKIITTWK